MFDLVVKLKCMTEMNLFIEMKSNMKKLEINKHWNWGNPWQINEIFHRTRRFDLCDVYL